MSQEKTALVLFSGGQDSAVCLAFALRHYQQVETVGFFYGQNHQIEMKTRLVFLQKYRDLFTKPSKRLGEDHIIDLSGFGKISHSSLAGQRAKQRRKDGLPDSYVPGRNLMFIIASAALAERRGLDVLVGGMCETDYSGYPDCRRTTMDAMEQTIRLGMELPIQIDTPLMHLTKAQTWELAMDLGGQTLVNLIICDSHTCYLGDRSQSHVWGKGCAKCDACRLRKQGFEQWQASL